MGYRRRSADATVLVVDQSIFDDGMGFDTLAFTADIGIPVSGAPHVALFLGVLAGGFLAVHMSESDRETMITGVTAGLVGTVVLWALAAFLTLSRVDGASADIAGLLINAVVLGALVGAVVAGTIYTVRNIVPDEDAAV